jgi:hypothetical protein
MHLHVDEIMLLNNMWIFVHIIEIKNIFSVESSYIVLDKYSALMVRSASYSWTTNAHHTRNVTHRFEGCIFYFYLHTYLFVTKTSESMKFNIAFYGWSVISE